MTLLQPAIIPAAAGTVQQATIGGLTVGTRIYVAMKATDDRGNISALSNVASGTPPTRSRPPR